MKNGILKLTAILAMVALAGACSSTRTQQSAGEVIDDSTLTAKVKWSKGSAPRGVNTSVSIPTALKIGGTYLIFAEADYTYTPTIGYVMKAAIKLSDFTYTRPRQSACVLYGTSSCPTT